jgi:Uma2 family endonuclease
MPAEAPTLDPPALLLLDARHRVTVDEYRRMAEAGVFGAQAKVELLEGVIVEKMTKNPPHVLATDLVQSLLTRTVPVGFFPSMGNPIAIDARDSEPEPDAAIVRGQPRDYEDRRRTAADVALVVEVSDTSYPLDRQQKWITYAAARIPVFWIVDLARRRLEIHSEPEGGGDSAYYAKAEILGPEDSARIVLDGVEVGIFQVAEILP